MLTTNILYAEEYIGKARKGLRGVASSPEAKQNSARDKTFSGRFIVTRNAHLRTEKDISRFQYSVNYVD